MTDTTQPREQAIPETTDEAREYLVAWHNANLPYAPYFSNYIRTDLAGDFAFHLARWLARSASPVAAPEAPTREQQACNICAGAPVLCSRHQFAATVDAQADTTTASASDDEADAYNHACELMEQFQDERAKRGVEIGTQGSLCDGIAWLFARIKELEGSAALTQQSAAQVPTLMRGAVASVASNADGEIRVNWMRPERVEAGTLLYVIVSAATEKKERK